MKFNNQGWVFAQTPIWAACDPNISNGAHRLLIYLDWRQGNDDSCWPSVARMARDLGAHPDTIRRRLRELEQAGYLLTTQRTGRSSEYSLVADPDRASDKYTPTPRSSAGGETTNRAQPPARLPEGDRKAAGPGPAGPPGGTRRTTGLDDTKEPDSKEKEKEERYAALWPSLLRNLRLQMTKGAFDLWLSDATARLEGHILYIQLEDQHAVAWVSQRLGGTISRTMHRLYQERDLSVAYEARSTRGSVRGGNASVTQINGSKPRSSPTVTGSNKSAVSVAERMPRRGA